MQDRQWIVALLKEDAIFSTSDSVRRRCITCIIEMAEDPLPILQEIVDSLLEVDVFRKYCLLKIEELKAE